MEDTYESIEDKELKRLDTINEHIEAMRELHKRGAFLKCANEEKKPINSVLIPVIEENEDGKYKVDENGKVVVKDHLRNPDSWNKIERHMLNGGRVLMYACAELGVMVLDFDPMVPEWLGTISCVLGREPSAVYKSSGLLKPKTDGKPEGYGGHAVWKIDPNNSVDTRGFSIIDEGFRVGEMFANFGILGVIVYDPQAILDVMDASGDIEVNPAMVPVANTNSVCGAKYNSEWKPDPHSRHDSTVSAVAYIANVSSTYEGYIIKRDHIEKEFRDSVGGEMSRPTDSEWKGIAAMGDKFWKRRERSYEIVSALMPEQYAPDTGGDEDTADTTSAPKPVPAPPKPSTHKIFDNKIGNVLFQEEDSYQAVVDNGRKHGVLLSHEFCHDNITFAKGLRHIGAQSRFLLPDETFQIRVKDVEGYVDWHDFRKGDEGVARRVYQHGVRQSMGVVKKKKQGKDYVYYADKLPDTWFKDPHLILNEFKTLRGTSLCPEVNIIEELMRKTLDEIDNMNEIEMGKHCWLSDNWLNSMENFKIAEEDIPMAKAFSRYSSTMMAIRLLQNLPEFRQIVGIIPQRHVPVLAGPPGCGKSAAMLNFLPVDGEWEILAGRRATSTFKSDMNLMHRDCHGKVMNIYDELAGIYQGNVDTIKDFIVEVEPNYDMKHLNPEQRTRTSFLAGTVNNLILPKDEAFRRRFFIVQVDRAKEDRPDPVQGRMVVDELRAKRMSIMYGGIITAMRIMKQIQECVKPEDPAFCLFEPLEEVLQMQYRTRREIDNNEDLLRPYVERIVAGEMDGVEIMEGSPRSLLRGCVFVWQHDAAKALGMYTADGYNTADMYDEWKMVARTKQAEISRMSKLFTACGWSLKGAVGKDRRSVYYAKKEHYENDRNAWHSKGNILAQEGDAAYAISDDVEAYFGGGPDDVVYRDTIH